MRRFITPLITLFLFGGMFATIALVGCDSKSDAPTPMDAPAQSGAKPAATPTLPPQVQVGPPK